MSDEEMVTTWLDSSTTLTVSSETLRLLAEQDLKEKAKPTPDGHPSSERSNTLSTKSKDPEQRTMPKGASPMMRMSWSATTFQDAKTASRNLADMMRGARITAPLHPCWTAYWTVWQGENELLRRQNSTRYGVTLWLELTP